MTKKIIIVRHAKSSWTDFSLADFDRPLDDRGKHDAPIMASLLKEFGHFPQQIITSPAVRAKQTATYFSELFGIVLDEIRDLYHGMPEDYLNEVHLLSENVNCVAFFGHNPGITYLANLVKNGCTDNVPTCGIVVLECAYDISWQKIEWQKMTIKYILTPKNPHP